MVRFRTVFDTVRPACGNALRTGSLATQARVSMYLTNRCHVAVRLFSNRLEMTSKCGKNKKVVHEAIAECVTDVVTTF